MFLPKEIRFLIYEFAFYKHKQPKKWNRAFNRCILDLPTKQNSGGWYMYYNPKEKHEPWARQRGRTFTYDPQVNTSPYVHFEYKVRLNNRTIYIQECTNCDLNNYDYNLYFRSRLVQARILGVKYTCNAF